MILRIFFLKSRKFSLEFLEWSLKLPLHRVSWCFFFFLFFALISKKSITCKFKRICRLREHGELSISNEHFLLLHYAFYNYSKFCMFFFLTPDILTNIYWSPLFLHSANLKWFIVKLIAFFKIIYFKLVIFFYFKY